MRIGCQLTKLVLHKSRGIKGVIQGAIKFEPYIVGIFLTEVGDVKFSSIDIQGVKKGELMVFDTAINLVGPQEVGGYILGRFEVWESDSKYRKIGDKILSAQRKVRDSGILNSLIDVALGGRRSVITKAIGLLGESLSGGGDDFLAGFDVDFDPENTPPGFVYSFVSPRASFTVQITN